mmetsp:Transcript_83784/g.227635  ORF Transcript_83784/g.227635 Transcript_83784/m.227635 type:complete len:124 (+) Transcript_83784:75-446(+)
MFLAEKRKDLPAGLTGFHSARQLSELWNEMEPDERKIWVDQAAELKREYEKAVEEYRNDPRNKELILNLPSINGGKPKKKKKGQGRLGSRPPEGWGCAAPRTEISCQEFNMSCVAWIVLAICG